MVKVFDLFKRHTPGKIDISEKLSPDINSIYSENLKISPQINDGQISVLKSICNAFTTPIFSVDTSYRYTSFNVAHAALMKQLYNADIQLLQNILDFITLDPDREKVKINLAKALKGKNYRNEDYFGDNEHSRLYFEVNYNPVYDKNNHIIGVAVFASEITSIKKAEDKYNETFINYNSIIETSPQAIIVTDNQGTIKLWNSAAENIFGWNNKEVVGQLSPFLPNNKLEEAKAVRERIMSGETIKNFETVRRHKSGALIDVSFSASPFRNSKGEIIGLLAIVADITERKYIENELQDSQLRFSKIFENSPVPMILGDVKSGKVILVNSSFEELIGLNQTGAYKSPFEFDINSNIVQISKSILENTVQNAGQRIEITLTHKSGKLIEVVFWRNTFKLNNDEHLFIGTAIDITKLREAEKLRDKSEMQLKTVMDNMLEGCQIIDFDWKYIYLNDTAARDSHSEKSKLLNRTMMECFPGIENTEMFSVLNECMEKRISRRIDNEFIYPDGTKGWFNLSVQPVPEGIFILSLDVTDQKIAETKFNTASERLKIATESAHIAIWDWDIANNNLVWDEQMYRLYGLKKEDFNGAYEAWLSGIHPDDREACNEISRRAVKGEIEYDTEFRVLWPDQSVHWIKANANVFRNEKGEPVRMIGVNYDITGRKTAEEALLSSRAEIEAALASMTDAVSISDTKGNFINFNEAFATFHKFNSKEDCVKTLAEYPGFLEVYTENGKSVPLEMWAVPRALRGEIGTNVEYHLQRKDTGVSWIGSFSFAPIRDSKGAITGAVVVGRDITEQKMLDEKIHKKDLEFRKLSANVPDLIFQFTRKPDGSYCVPIASDGIRNIFGCSPEEVINDFAPIGRVIYPEDAERVIRDIEYSAEHLTYFTCEFRVQIPGREIQWIYSKSTPERLPDGSITWYGFNTDITHKKQIEEALKEYNSRLELAMQAANMAWWEMDITSGKVVFDQRKSEMLGYPVEMFTHYKDFIALLHPDDVHNAMQSMQMHIDGLKDKYEIEYRILTKSGAYKWFFDIGAVVKKDASGIPLKVTGLVIDITERKQAEIELQNSRENFSRAFDSNPTALVITRMKNGEILKINSAYTRIFGYTENEIIGSGGKDKNMFIEPADRSVFVKLLNRDGAIRGMEIKLRVKSGDVSDMLLYMEIIHFDNDECILSALIDITKRKQAEVALKNSRESFSRTFESNPAALVITRLKDGKIIKINSTYSLTIGYQPEEIIGRYGSEFNIFADPDDRQALLETLQKNKTVKDYECRIRVKNGSIKNMIIFMEPIFFEEEDCILSALLDITARKQAEENLRESDERLQQIINQSQTVIWEIDARGMYTFVSPLSKNVWGYNPEELIGKKYYYDLHPELGRKIFKEQTQKIFDRKENFQNFINPIETGDGGIVWVVTNGVAITDENNKLIGYRGSDKDITELKNAENEIRILNEELEERIQERTAELADLYNNAPCGYHSLDANGLFELINDTELKWLGYNRNELIGKVNALGLLTEKSKQIFIENFPILKKQGSREDLELDFIRKDGSILSVLLNATAIHDKDGNFLRSRSTIIDHTQRKKAEELLREALTRLETANKELEAFSYSVSHDLRAPLRAIGGFAKILSDDYNQVLDQEGKRICDVISSSTEKMGKLIDDLLAFSRLGRSDIRFVHIDMEQMVRNIIADYYPDSDFNNTTFVVKKLPRVKGDIDMLKQVWINLISNAVKYSSKNQKSLVEIDYEDLENEIIYRIKDNGVGFEMQYVNKLFGVFQRLHNSKTFDGTGVGLAIVHRIIQRHSGRVWGEGIPNKGATFYFSLPKI